MLSCAFVSLVYVRSYYIFCGERGISESRQHQAGSSSLISFCCAASWVGCAHIYVHVTFVILHRPPLENAHCKEKKPHPTRPRRQYSLHLGLGRHGQLSNHQVAPVPLYLHSLHPLATWLAKRIVPISLSWLVPYGGQGAGPQRLIICLDICVLSLSNKTSAHFLNISFGCYSLHYVFNLFMKNQGCYMYLSISIVSTICYSSSQCYRPIVRPHKQKGAE